MSREAATNYYDEPLFKLLSERFPEFRTSQGIFSVADFAAAVGRSKEGVYKWFRKGRLTPEAVKLIVDASKHPKTGAFRVKREDLVNFCFPA